MSKNTTTCGCTTNSKIYVFKNECAKFLFCHDCIDKSKHSFSFFLLEENPSNYNYNCCGKVVNNRVYRLYTLHDALQNISHPPVACNECRHIEISRLKLDNTFSIKLCEFTKDRLCKHIIAEEAEDTEKVYCLTSASYELNHGDSGVSTCLPRCASHKGILHNKAM